MAIGSWRRIGRRQPVDRGFHAPKRRVPLREKPYGMVWQNASMRYAKALDGQLPESRILRSMPRKAQKTWILRLVFHLFGALAQFERDLIRERTRAGLQAPEERGRRGGRQAVVTGTVMVHL